MVLQAIITHHPDLHHPSYTCPLYHRRLFAILFRLSTHIRSKQLPRRSGSIPHLIGALGKYAYMAFISGLPLPRRSLRHRPPHPLLKKPAHGCRSSHHHRCRRPIPTTTAILQLSYPKFPHADSWHYPWRHLRLPLFPRLPIPHREMKVLIIIITISIVKAEAAKAVFSPMEVSRDPSLTHQQQSLGGGRPR
jgi:hypothetical protein